MTRHLLLSGLIGLAGLAHSLPNPNHIDSRDADPLINEHQEYSRAEPGGWNQIITGVYSQPPLIKIHDRQGMVQWSFSRTDVEQRQQLPPSIQQCINSPANDATDMKWIRNGTAIAAVYSNTVLIINYAPGQPQDKQVDFAACRSGNYLANSHTLEPLPDGKIAVATTGARPWDGIVVFDSNEKLVNAPQLVQNITGLRAVHGMVWDETARTLWAAGTSAAPDGSDGVPSFGVIQGYPYVNGELQVNPSLHFQLPQAHHQDPEWGPNYGWWVGPHDLSPVPNQRKLIMTDDQDMRVFDVDLHQFIAQGQDVVNTYLKGFQPTTNDRHGLDRNGQPIDLPRSDVKSVSLAPNGDFVYVQSLWKRYQGNETNLVVGGTRRTLDDGELIYRARFFADIPGWPKPAA